MVRVCEWPTLGWALNLPWTTAPPLTKITSSSGKSQIARHSQKPITRKSWTRKTESREIEYLTMTSAALQLTTRAATKISSRSTTWATLLEASTRLRKMELTCAKVILPLALTAINSNQTQLRTRHLLYKIHMLRSMGQQWELQRRTFKFITTVWQRAQTVSLQHIEVQTVYTSSHTDWLSEWSAMPTHACKVPTWIQRTRFSSKAILALS